MRERAEKNNCWERERNIPSFSQGFLFREKVVLKYVAEMAIKGLNEVGKVIKGSKVLIMGLTYKENVPDTRESPVREKVKELKEFVLSLWIRSFTKQREIGAWREGSGRVQCHNGLCDHGGGA